MTEDERDEWGQALRDSDLAAVLRNNGKGLGIFWDEDGVITLRCVRDDEVLNIELTPEGVDMYVFDRKDERITTTFPNPRHKIFALRAQGRSYGEIAKVVGLSRQRCHQIARGII